MGHALERSRWVGTVLLGLALVAHTFGNHSLLRMDGRERFVVDNTTLALVLGIMAAQALPAVRRLGFGDANVEFGVEAARAAVNDVPGVNPGHGAALEEAAVPDADPSLIAIAVLSDLTVALRDLGRVSGLPFVETKPPALLASELERSGGIDTKVARAVLALVRSAQAAAATGRMSRREAQELRRLSYVILEALQPAHGLDISQES